MERSEIGRSLNLSEMMIARGRRNRPGVRIRPTSITIHNTDNDNAGADASAHGRWVTKTGFYMLKGKEHWVSWHYSVDDERVVKHLPINEAGYHAGRPANLSSIAIEICMNSDIDQAAADDRAARLVAVLLYDIGLDIDQVRTHQSWTGKHCPRRLIGRSAGMSWAEFRQAAERYRSSIERPSAEADVPRIEELGDLPSAAEVAGYALAAEIEERMGGELDHERMKIEP